MTIYFDENLPKHLAEGFNTIQFPEGIKSGITVNVKSLPEVYGYGAKDYEWIPMVGGEGCCVITPDLNIHRRKDELALYRDNKVGMFFLKGPNRKQGMSIWEMTIALSKNWEKIIQIANSEKGPFAYQFYLNRGMNKMN